MRTYLFSIEIPVPTLMKIPDSISLDELTELSETARGGKAPMMGIEMTQVIKALISQLEEIETELRDIIPNGVMQNRVKMLENSRVALRHAIRQLKHTIKT